MTRDGVGTTVVGRACGKDPSSVTSWLNHECYPTSTLVAESLADFFDYQGLVTALVADKSRRCVECRRQFQQHLKRARYCSKRCMSRGRSREYRGTRNAQLLTVVTHERDMLREAVDRNCRSCEHDGVCKDARCDFQKMGLSPFPLILIQRKAG